MTSLLPAAGGTAEATAAGAAGASDGADGADDLRTLVLGWLATKRSVHTRRAYASDLAEWLTWCDSRGAGPLAATEALAAGWARHLEARGLAASTVARRLSCVSSWYSWLVRGGHSAGNPAAYLARPDVDRDTSTTPGLTRDQALALIAAADQARGPQAARTSALIAVLLLTGARVSELTGADLEDLGTDRGHRVLRVTRKGGRRQALGVPAPAVKRLDAYLAARGDLASLPAVPGQPGTARARRALFATQAGARLFPADVWHLIRRLGQSAGLPGDLVSRLGPHAMRHSFATLYLDAGGSLRDLQDAMGHADPRTTRRYDRARYSLDRSPGYVLAGYLAAGDPGQAP
ncbi:MAG TPA: tyrosine-type recombinase/integrase [Streptosporangiaceae bacterium]|nr:tyrosine-type recombinase/integrase [Streptosporangiaceae bacterium]